VRVPGRAIRQDIDVNHDDNKSVLPSPYPPPVVVPTQVLITSKITQLCPVLHPRQEAAPSTVELLVHDTFGFSLVSRQVVAAWQAARSASGFISETQASVVLEDNACSLANTVRMIKVEEGYATSGCHNLCRSYMRTAWHDIANKKTFSRAASDPRRVLPPGF
jgi:hypothetical protein